MKNKKSIHQWDVLAVSCIDGRFITKVIDWIAEKTNDVFDFHTEVGDTKAIIKDKEARKVFFGIIDVSLKLHRIKELWIFDHIDCGAYGGSKAFKNLKEEKKFHVKKLKKLELIIKKRYPKLKIKKFYVEWEKIVRV